MKARFLLPKPKTAALNGGSPQEKWPYKEESSQGDLGTSSPIMRREYFKADSISSRLKDLSQWERVDSGKAAQKGLRA